MRLLLSIELRRPANPSSNSSSAAGTVPAARSEQGSTRLFYIALKYRWPVHWRSFKEPIREKFPRTWPRFHTGLQLTRETSCLDKLFGPVLTCELISRPELAAPAQTFFLGQPRCVKLLYLVHP